MVVEKETMVPLNPELIHPAAVSDSSTTLEPIEKSWGDV